MLGRLASRHDFQFLGLQTKELRRLASCERAFFFVYLVWLGGPGMVTRWALATVTLLWRWRRWNFEVSRFGTN